MREVNLAGDTVREISINDLNTELAAATCAECNVTLQTFHHYVEPFPMVIGSLLANTIMALSSTSTPPLTNAPAQNVLGDVIVDLDQNMQPVWVWNEFNHLDPNRHPYMFPDWTHTNALIYSPDDGNILVSMRHQNWVIKVDYADGAGDGQRHLASGRRRRFCAPGRNGSNRLGIRSARSLVLQPEHYRGLLTGFDGQWGRPNFSGRCYVWQCRSPTVSLLNDSRSFRLTRPRKRLN